VKALLVGMIALQASWAFCAADKAKGKGNPNSSAATPIASTTSVAPSSLPLLPAPTQPISLPLVLQRFEDLDKNLKSLQADFTQYVAWDASGTKQTVEGAVEFRKPDLLRIEQRVPEPQTVVADGSWLWIYRPSTNQAIKANFADWKKTEPMAQGLLDFGNYARRFQAYDVTLATAAAPAADGHRLVTLTLKPKAKGEDFALTLKLSTRDYFPAETELRAGGVAIHSFFSNIRYNPALPDARFRFTPPAGADVFENPKPPKAP
jgi:outer membrane lipoprotein carrier protein